MAETECAGYSRGVRGACRHCGLPRDHANHAVVTGEEAYVPRHALRGVRVRRGARPLPVVLVCTSPW